MQKISPFLWFENQAEEAAKYYVSLFKNSKMGKVTRYPKGTPLPEGSVMTATFVIEGQDFTAMNGGPTYKFTPAISFVVTCETQPEIDHYWDKLLADGGKEMGCGWIADKFGLCWQIVPAGIGDLIANPDKAKAERATAAMLQMTKLDIEKLRNA
ncbi:MAG TPA: VOC family protein [Polyangia bacterium]|nr:VOC family protein [Polyangia bacterium]